MIIFAFFLLLGANGELTCSDFGAKQECNSASGGSCQIGCDVAHCDGGKCDQRLATKCFCDGGNCWEFGCSNPTCDGGNCSIENTPPNGCTAPSCTGTTINPLSTTTTPSPHNLSCDDYGLTQDCSGAADGACQIGCAAALCDGGKCDQRNAGACKCDGGSCWQLGCGSESCDGGNCSNDSNPPVACVSPSCTGTTTTKHSTTTPSPSNKSCTDYGLTQDCSGASDGACQIGCATAACDGGKCDQRTGLVCKCDGGNCWQFGCRSASCDGGNCSNDDNPPAGCTCPSCQQGQIRMKKKNLQLKPKVVKY